MPVLDVALLGAGRRARSVYLPILSKLKSIFRVTAVLDPVREAAESLAGPLEARPFGSLRELLRVRPMQAALIVTPAESHHALSVVLSRNGVPHSCETPMAQTYSLARLMVDEARARGVVLHINEQFFRGDLVALFRKIVAAGVIGPVKRIVYWGGHVGVHNHSIFLAFSGWRAPLAVNALEHEMPVHRYLDVARRWNEREPFHLRSFHFPDDLLVVDAAANVKGALGRTPRPGHLELHGTEGTLVEIPGPPDWPWTSGAEVRLVPPGGFEQKGYARGHTVQCVHVTDGREELSPVLHYSGEAHALRVSLPGGTFEDRNPVAECGILNSYQSSVAQGLLDFARAVRGEAPGEFTPAAALATMEMEAACLESAERQGARVALPLAGAVAREARELEALRKKTGVDPLDAEALVDVAFPKNYSA